MLCKYALSDFKFYIFLPLACNLFLKILLF